MADYLFAYGTLQPGLMPAEIAETAVKLRPVGNGFIYGELFQLNGYPGAVPDPTSTTKIAGTILELPADEDILGQLDEYEGYDPANPQTSEFLRIRQSVQLNNGGTIECWMYCYNRLIRENLAERSSLQPNAEQEKDVE